MVDFTFGTLDYLDPLLISSQNQQIAQLRTENYYLKSVIAIIFVIQILLFVSNASGGR